MFGFIARHRWRISIVCAALACMSATQAAPMAYKGGIMFMSEYSESDAEAGANHAVTARDAFGVMFARQTGSTGLKRSTQHATYTRLAKRWNLPDAQANVWLTGNVEQVRGDGLNGSVTAWEPGFQVDYETTRLYFAANWHSQRAAGANDALVRHNAAALRAGFSFYNAEYDEVQPWLIVQTKRETGWTRERSLTPMLRLIHKSYFLELGVKRDLIERKNSAQVNLMLVH
jgi:hypothetical protein